MTGNKLEKEIIGIFNRDISSFLSINQISKRLHKAYPYINSKVNSLINEGVLTKFNIGRSYQCSINLNSERAVALLTLNEVEKKEKLFLKIKNINKALEDIKNIKNEFKIYTILLYNNSLIFVLDYLHDQEAIKNLFHSIKQFDLIFLDKSSFKKYLLANKSKLHEHAILYSYEKYFEIMGEVKDMSLLSNINNYLK